MSLVVTKRLSFAVLVVPMFVASGQPPAVTPLPINTAAQSALAQLRPDNTTCISCHSPVGTELFSSGFTRADFARRASRHMGASDAKVVAETLASVRVPKTPTSWLFPVHTTQSKKMRGERDTAFGTRLRTATPRFTSGLISSPKAALDAAAQLLSHHPSRIEPGIVIDPLSREPGLSDRGLLIGDWIPDVPLSPERTSILGSKAAEISGHAASDDTKRNELALQMVYAITDRPQTPLATLAFYKRAALLQFGQPWKAFTPTTRIPENPIWAVGNQLRIMHNRRTDELGISLEECRATGLKSGDYLQTAGSAVSWFWVCFATDPTLESMSLDIKARNGQYFLQALADTAEAPWTAAYAASYLVLARSRIRPQMALQPDFTAFVNNDQILKNAPREKAQRLLYQTWLRNALRMVVYLMLDDINAGMPVFNAVGASQQLTDFLRSINALVPAAKQADDARLVKRALATLALFREQQLHPKP
jgi:hypothetical protein